MEFNSTHQSSQIMTGLFLEGSDLNCGPDVLISDPVKNPNSQLQPFSLPIALAVLIFFSAALRIIKFLVKRSTRLVTISIQLTGGNTCTANDVVYSSLLRWLGRNCEGSIRSKKIFVKTISSKKDDESGSDSEDEHYRPSPDYEWAYHLNQDLGYGINNIMYKGVWIRAHRRLCNPSAALYDVPQEMLTLTTWFWNKWALDAILELSKPKPKKVNNQSQIVMYRADPVDLCWNRLGGPKKKRSLASLILESQTLQKLLEDVKTFLDMEEWYVDKGIPYRRGYLIYGPPGCGKSSVIKAIAGELGYNICVFSLSQNLTDDGLTQLFNVAPEKSIILLEDIDAAFKSRENEANSSRETNLAFEGCSLSALTFMGLLNSLDGVASSDDGQIIFMTSNYPERLDPALIRPGRVDMKVRIGYPTDKQVEGMFKKFYPEKADDEEMIRRFINSLRALDLKLSMAMIQGLLLVYRDDPEAAITNAEEHFKEQFTNANLGKCSTGLYC